MDGVSCARAMVREGVEIKTAMKLAAKRTGMKYGEIARVLGVRLRRGIGEGIGNYE